jgi:hypothetical protein
MVLRVLAPVACAYSLTAEVSLVATNRQGAIAVRAGPAEQQTVDRDSLIRAYVPRKSICATKPVADVEAQLAALKLDQTWQRAARYTNVTLYASWAFCTRAATVTAELERANVPTS